MKKLCALLVILAVSLISFSSFAKENEKATVEKSDEAIIIKASGGVYLYSLKEKQAMFLALIQIEGKNIVMQVILDKKDKPQLIVLLAKDKNGKIQQAPLPKSNPDYAPLYKEMEQHIDKFIKEHDVKKILRENGVK